MCGGKELKRIGRERRIQTKFKRDLFSLVDGMFCEIIENWRFFFFLFISIENYRVRTNHRIESSGKRVQTFASTSTIDPKREPCFYAWKVSTSIKAWFYTAIVCCVWGERKARGARVEIEHENETQNTSRALVDRWKCVFDLFWRFWVHNTCCSKEDDAFFEQQQQKSINRCESFEQERDFPRFLRHSLVVVSCLCSVVE